MFVDSSVLVGARFISAPYGSVRARLREALGRLLQRQGHGLELPCLATCN